MTEMLLHAVQRGGTTPSVLDDGVALTWAAFAGLAAGYAAQLHAAGVGRGDRVALWLSNSADHLALIFAVARLGAMTLHLNPRFRAHDVGAVLRKAQPGVLVTDFAARGANFAAILAELDPADTASLRRVITRGVAPGVRCSVPVELLQAGTPIADMARPDDACLAFTTTGTTGPPKLVVVKQHAVASHNWWAMRHLGLDQPDAAALAILPFCGSFGHNLACWAVAGGARLVCSVGADVDSVIRRHRITHLAGFADVLAWVVEAARNRPHDSVRQFLTGVIGQGDDTAVVAAARHLGLAPRSHYGSSESRFTAVAPDDWGEDQGGVLVNPGSSFTIRSRETGQDLDEGESGELLLRGPQLFSGYLNDTAATTAAFTEDGWFRTRDRAYRRGNGFVFLGRYDEALRLGGVLVDPSEIEAFLCAQPSIAAARVVGADGGQGLRAVAFVIAASGASVDEAALLAVCRQQIAAYKVPARIVTLPAFPVQQGGANAEKIHLAALREMAVALLRN